MSVILRGLSEKMLSQAKISLGIPFYGSFSGEWTTQTMQFAASLAKEHNLMDIIAVGNMTADHNRNTIVDEFLKSQAEWLFWIDSDTLVPVGAVSRMLEHGRTLVSGLYYGKNPPHPPIAYTIYNGGYTPIDSTLVWEKGEIIPIDAPGMGCMLTHRSVFEDIKANYSVFQMDGGGLYVVHNNDVLGDVETTNGIHHHEHDSKMYKGQLRLRMMKPTLANIKFPFFQVEHQRTEDMFFFPLAARVGHKPVLDTSVECGHLRWNPFTGENYRELKGH